MNNVINARELRKSLGDILNRVQQGERFNVIYRSHFIGQLVPPEDTTNELSEPLFSNKLESDITITQQELLEHIRILAAQHGVTVEEEVRQILQQVVSTPQRLGDLAVELFNPAYGGEELILPEREVQAPMEFPE